MTMLKVVEQSSWITINGRSVPFAAFIAFEAAAALLCLGLALVCIRAAVRFTLRQRRFEIALNRI